MTDFLLELLSEEIPARMQAKARADLQRLFTEQMTAAGLKAGAITVWSTPRRLALIARGLPAQTEAVSEEAKGPPEAAPDQAVEGFCRKNEVTRDQLEVRDVKGRPTYFAVINKPGRDTQDVLAEAIPAIIRAFPWPKSMRWGDASASTESLRWVRPLSGIVAIFGDDLVPCEIDGMTSAYDTVGHRFHHDGMITIGNADDYVEKLRACHVIVDHEERQNIIRDGAAKAASDAGLELVEDEGLVIENAGLTEWPVPLLGAFDPAFLDVPEEVIQLTARVNQKYFVCKYPPNAQDGGGAPPSAVPAATSPSLRDREEKLAPYFVCTANIDASDGGKAIVAGNEKVLAARLSDAKFFWELDQKTALEDHAKKLSNIVFHEKLGTVADKVERVAKLAEWLASLEGTGLLRANPEQTKQAARLCKADLVTEMVGEFPELQGLMGGYYAEKEELPVEVSQAIRDHYKPVGQGDDVPTDPVTVWVSLADKLDTLACFFAIDEKPTGSKDPFALRRAGIANLSLWHDNKLRGSHLKVLRQAIAIAAEQMPTLKERLENLSKAAGVSENLLKRAIDREAEELWGFLVDRLKVQQREAGVRHDLIDAVFALGGEDDLVRLLARVKALQAFVETTDGENLLAGYKRASNILKKEGAGAVRVERSRDTDEGRHGLSTSLETNGEGLKPLSYTPEKAEKTLIDALDAAQPQVTAAIEAEQFEQAMTALAALRGPIDQFFEDVTVNDDDGAKREARLALLARFRNAVHQVADFSKIEG
ncbi:glycine--tRNA ligase subunit beta [Parasphingorhabdus flavimaris]|uniref:Glycine--tRNA ligase beta subunit n=1 Tax=Parasphingorhabdus flavimaris TaxID=266812 RepID=A0ABX2N2A7_9SPHN|nr:glycine--tRNA ligase subunit beta [Parasphingorhabdus flavimaris]NVD27716.1 glycine--tRNA ligase subunit beta [Parasphingorhabdus flavimaris]